MFGAARHERGRNAEESRPQEWVAGRCPWTPAEAEPAPDASALTPEHVFQEYAPRIYHLARRLLGKSEDAEDVTQDVLLQVIRKLATFRGEAALWTWLYRMTVNAALRYREQRAGREAHRLHEPIEEFGTHGEHLAPVRHWVAEPAQEALDQEMRQLIEAAIAQLPAAYRDVYVLADVEGLPNAEIAELLGLSVQAVKSRLHRARLLMRKALAPHFEKVPA
jgi:RNA polymerase sigma-70 factor (ECF subfamily)